MTIISVHQLAFFFMFFSGGLWAMLSPLGPAYYVPLILLVLAWDLCGRFEKSKMAAVAPARPRWEQLALGAAVALPAFLYIALSWRREFPFYGDSNWHLRLAQDAWRVFRFQLPIGIVLSCVAYKWRPRYFATVAMLALVATSAAVRDWAPYPRYPQGFYFFALPFTCLSRFAHWSEPFNASRLASAAALPAWLFVFRPLLIGRWPDRRVILPCFFLFLHEQGLFYLTHNYPEPWSAIWILLAVELLASDEERARWLSPLLCGIACTFREQAVLALPFIWLAAHGKRLRGRKDWPTSLLNGLTAGAPFLVYMGFRTKVQIWRTFNSLPLARAFSFERVIEYFSALHGALFAGFVGVLLVCVLLTLFSGLRAKRAVLPLLLGAALVQVIYFWLDRETFNFTGYYRLQMVAFAIMTGPLFLMPSLTRGRAWAFSFLFVLPLISLARGFRLLSLPDPARNFVEWRGQPYYLPFRELLERAPEEVTKVRVLLANYPAQEEYFLWQMSDSVSVGYPALAKRFHFDVLLARNHPEACRCETLDTAVAFFPIYQTRPEQWASASYREDAVVDACIAKMRESCSGLELRKMADGVVTGMLGSLNGPSRDLSSSAQ